MARGNRARTIQRYNAVLAAYRELGVHHQLVADRVKMDRLTAKRLYERGWPTVQGALPVRDQLQMDSLLARAARAGITTEEQKEVVESVLSTSLAQARTEAIDATDMLVKAAENARVAEAKAMATLDAAQAQLAKVEELARSKVDDAQKAAQATLQGAEIEAKRRLADLLVKAKVDAAETLADEANAAKFGRKAALSAAAIVALLLKDAQTIAAQLHTALGDLSKLSPREAIKTARDMMHLAEMGERTIILALQGERLRVGQPTEVIGVQSMDSSIEEREIKLKAVARALERAKAKGLILVQGGAGAGPTSGAEQHPQTGAGKS